MVESICRQGFAYAREVEEKRLRKLVKLDKRLQKIAVSGSKNSGVGSHPVPPFICVK
jgi:hypothetical protein